MKDQQDIAFFLSVLATILDLVMQVVSIFDVFFGWIAEFTTSTE